MRLLRPSFFVLLIESGVVSSWTRRIHKLNHKHKHKDKDKDKHKHKHKDKHKHIACETTNKTLSSGTGWEGGLGGGREVGKDRHLP